MCLTRWMTLVGIGVVFGGAWGCAPRPVTLHPDFGVTYESVVQAQTLNRQTDGQDVPVVGLDGYAGVTLMYDYRKSFEAEKGTVQGGSVITQTR